MAHPGRDVEREGLGGFGFRALRLSVGLGFRGCLRGVVGIIPPMRPRRNRYARKPVTYVSEAALCEVLAALARAEGLVVYPETSGWDLLLVRPEDGEQVGVQAKLRPNVDVLEQALVGARAKGPEVHAVLVPSCSAAFRRVALELNLCVLEGYLLDPEHGMDRGARGWWRLREVLEKAPRHHHLPGRCWVPPFVPNLPAGVPGPRSVTPWKVHAAQMCARVRAGEALSNREVRSLGMDPTSFDLVPGEKPARYRPRADTSLPDVGFPEVCLGLGLPDPRCAAAPGGG